MEVSELQSHLKLYKSTYIANLQGGSYQMSPILGVEILKDKGKARLLGDFVNKRRPFGLA